MHDWRAYVRENLPPLRTRPEREAEIVDEIAQQLEQAYAQALTRGVSEDEAARIAREEVTDWESFAGQLTPRPEAPPSESWMGQLWYDLRHAARQAFRPRSTAVLSLAVIAGAIGAGTAVFSLAYGILFRPLPYQDPERLVLVESRSANRVGLDSGVSGGDFHDLRGRVKSLESAAGVSPVWNLSVKTGGNTDMVEGLFVSAELFPMLGVTPAHGRFFAAAEDQPGRGAPVAVLGHEYWLRRFGGDRSVVGRGITVESGPVTVVGVMPRDFRYLGRAGEGFSGIELWLPLALNPLMERSRSLRFLQVMAKRRAGTTLSQVEAELAGLSASLAAAYPGTNQGFTFRPMPVLDRVTGKARQPLLLLLAAIVLALGIACANLASVRLANLAARAPEVAVRQALGGSPGRLARQWLLESLILAASGALAGWALARLLLGALVALAPASLPRKEEVTLDATALLFAAGAALLATLLPAGAALLAMRRAPVDALRERGRVGAGGLGLRRALVVAEIALGVVLALGAGLLVRSFRASLESDAGYRKANLLTLSMQMPANLARDAAGREALLDRILAAVRTVPGVVEAGAASRLPLTNSTLTSWLTREGKPVRVGDRPEVEYRRATAEYFGAMGVPLKNGRLWDERDRAARRQVALINEAAARRFFEGENPVGQRVRFGDDDSPFAEIVGVMGDLRHAGLDEASAPEVYQPQYLSPLSSPILAVQTKGPVSMATIQAAIRRVDPGVPVYRTFPIEELITRSLAPRRFVTTLASGFAALALLLAALGVYGIVAQMVTERRREIGVRMALGAQPAGVMRLVLGDGARLAVAGGVAGMALALVAVRAMKSLLFGVEPFDPVTFGLVPVALMLLAVAAAAGPAWRASRVDPLAALRDE